MPSLANDRHERFAQNLASGMTQKAAHSAAGFGGSSAHASTLARSQAIRDRVDELMTARTAAMREEARATYLEKAPPLYHRRDEAARATEESALAIRARVDATTPAVVDLDWIKSQLVAVATAAREAGSIGSANRALAVLDQLRVAEEFVGSPRRRGRAPAFVNRGWGHNPHR